MIHYRGGGTLGRALLLLGVLPELLLAGLPVEPGDRQRGPLRPHPDAAPQQPPDRAPLAYERLEAIEAAELAQQRAFAAASRPRRLRDRSAQREHRRGRAATKARRGF